MRTWNRKPRPSSSGALAAVALSLALSVVAAPGPVRAAEAPDTTVSTPLAPKKTIIRENSYYYGAFNRRDPFRSLVEGTFVRDTVMELVDLTAVELVGVVRGDLDRFALLEDEKGFTYIMRVGDKVRNGTIVAVGDDTMTARITTFGQTSQYTLRMVQRQKGDKR
jgi:hypothetical protein